MVFKSFYTRIIFILATMSVTLFIILAGINTIVFRNETRAAFAELERPRMMQLFRVLDEKVKNPPDLQLIQSI